MKRAWILNDLYVDAEARKQGIGEMLLHKAKDSAIETGAKSISLKKQRQIIMLLKDYMKKMDIFGTYNFIIMN